jgi:excisionase family DNA binding protein
MNNKLLKPHEISERLNVSKPQVYIMLRNGEIPVVRIGRCVRVREIDLENYIQKNLEQNNKNQAFWANSKPGHFETSSLKKEQSHE